MSLSPTCGTCWWWQHPTSVAWRATDENVGDCTIPLPTFDARPTPTERGYVCVLHTNVSAPPPAPEAMELPCPECHYGYDCFNGKHPCFNRRFRMPPEKDVERLIAAVTAWRDMKDGLTPDNFFYRTGVSTELRGALAAVERKP